MPAIDRALDNLSFLPDALRDALGRRVRELVGIAFVVLALLLTLALATWSVHDPSLSHATSRAARNLMGLPGAVVADLLMQLLGLASIALVLPIAVWGWRLLTHRPLSRERIRLLFWMFGVLLAAGFAAALPRSSIWPLPSGLGGVAGDWLMRLPLFLAGGNFAAIVRAACALVCGIGALTCLAVVVGYGWHAGKIRRVDARGDEDTERASISLGRVVHGFLSLKARFSVCAGRAVSPRFPHLRPGRAVAGARRRAHYRRNVARCEDTMARWQTPEPAAGGGARGAA